jgi:hypothetical protein
VSSRVASATPQATSSSHAPPQGDIVTRLTKEHGPYFQRLALRLARDGSPRGVVTVSIARYASRVAVGTSDAEPPKERAPARALLQRGHQVSLLAAEGSCHGGVRWFSGPVSSRAAPSGVPRSQAQILPSLQRENRRSERGSWFAMGPVLAFGVSKISADIASR